MSHPLEQHLRAQGAHGELAVHVQGPPQAPAVLMTHSILSSSAMWDAQAALLLSQGYRVVRVDTIGHGNSAEPTGPVTMDGLANDAVAVLDALGIARAHHVGLSLGGMSGFGLGIHHGDRWLSLVLSSTRADAPPEAAPWHERIALARAHGSCTPLAAPTIERWFGPAFMAAQPETVQRLQQIAATTTVAGFTGCAQAILSLDYLDRVGAIRAPTTLLVGSRDGVLPEAMRALQSRIAGAVLEVINDAGHLPNIDQAEAFNAALLRHFHRFRV